MGKSIPEECAGYTVMGWVQALAAQCDFRLHHEEDPTIRSGLQAIREHAESLHKFCRKKINPTPTAVTVLFKHHLLEELAKIVLLHENLGYIQFMSELKNRDKRSLEPGRSPHYSQYFVGVFREDVKGKEPTMVGRVHVADADDPGINIDSMLSFVCLWLRGYVEMVGLEVRFDRSVREYAERF